MEVAHGSPHRGLRWKGEMRLFIVSLTKPRCIFLTASGNFECERNNQHGDTCLWQNETKSIPFSSVTTSVTLQLPQR